MKMPVFLIIGFSLLGASAVASPKSAVGPKSKPTQTVCKDILEPVIAKFTSSTNAEWRQSLERMAKGKIDAKSKFRSSLQARAQLTLDFVDYVAARRSKDPMIMDVLNYMFRDASVRLENVTKFLRLTAVDSSDRYEMQNLATTIQTDLGSVSGTVYLTSLYQVAGWEVRSFSYYRSNGLISYEAEQENLAKYDGILGIQRAHFNMSLREELESFSLLHSQDIKSQIEDVRELKDHIDNMIWAHNLSVEKDY